MEEQKDVLILAIESSCDETAAAVVKNGRTYYLILLIHRLLFIQNMVELFRR